MGSEELPQFLFEIASEERLGVLEAVAERPLRHAEIARRLKMTGSETTRHLNRLTAAGLVERNGRGEYEPTQLARALRLGLPFFEFLVAHRAYLLAHQVRILEPPFVERLGELGRATFVEGTYRVVAVQEAALREVTRRIWVVTEQPFEQALPILREKAEHGADVRVVRPRDRLEEEKRTGPDIQRNFPVKSLAAVNLFLAVLDDQAGLCLPTLDGKIDMGTMIQVRDPEGRRWAEDLFSRLWSRADDWRIPAAHSG